MMTDKSQLLNESEKYFSSQDYSSAVEILLEAARQYPDDANVIATLGLAYEKIKEILKARDCYQQVLRINPNTAQAHHGLARLVLRGPHYLDAMKKIHSNLKPGSYVEVGIREGASFRLANSRIPAVGIDPNPLIKVEKNPEWHLIVHDTSDNYFKSSRLLSDLGGRKVDLAFIDGMHLFEFVLRDFIALEKASHQEAVIVVHDCYPLDELTAQREQDTFFWSGDVWKIILCLKKYRPDLNITTFPCPPTGLAVITGLDPHSSILSDSLEIIYDEYVTMDFSVIEQDRPQKLNLIDPDAARSHPLIK